MMNHKKLLIGCGCALLAIALVVCLVLVIGNGAGEKPTLPSNGTDGTTQGTAPDGTSTNPTDGTTTPTGPDATDPTEPSFPIVTEPTEPDVGPTDPSTGEEIIPTNPGTEPTNPDLSDEYDFGHITPGNITIDDWNAWDTRKKQAFLDSFDPNNMDPKDKHNYMVVVWYNGYRCNAEGHACKDEVSHNRLIAEMEQGCFYCGKSDCPSFFALDENLFTKIDVTKCPEYGVEKDPTQYCQECGLKLLGKCKSGEKGCISVISPIDCPFCGIALTPGKCHECTKP